jgi:hypothetical protein
LELVELPINPAHCQQLLMRAGLAQLAFVHDEDAVSALDGGQAVRDHDGRSALHEAAERFANAISVSVSTLEVASSG